MVERSDTTVGVLLGDGQENFGAPRYFTVAAGFLAVGDFNRDSIPDVAITQPGERMVIMMGDGQGNFSAPTAFDTGRSPVALAIGDFNGDEIPDIVTADNVSGTVSVLLNTT
ncbi:MAG: VCBS repeat-containing protein [Acidobacteria bacterium]|nr:VCBS repeat-containing protein [Acidobacteriota bacterium]